MTSNNVIPRMPVAVVESETTLQRGAIPRDPEPLRPGAEAAFAAAVEAICAPHRHPDINLGI